MNAMVCDASGYVRAMRVEELPVGTGTTLSLAGKWIAVFHAESGVHVTDNACPHSAGPLGAGQLEGDVVTCPLHGWQFDVAKGVCVANPNVPLGRYDVRVDDGGWIWVRLMAQSGNADCTE